MVYFILIFLLCMNLSFGMDQLAKPQGAAEAAAIFQCMICQENKSDSHSLRCENNHSMCPDCGDELILTQLISGTKTICPSCRFEFDMEQAERTLSAPQLRGLFKQLRPKLKTQARANAENERALNILSGELAASQLGTHARDQIAKSILRRAELRNLINLNQENFSVRSALISRCGNYLTVAFFASALLNQVANRTTFNIYDVLKFTNTTAGILRPFLSIESILNDYQIYKKNLEEIDCKQRILSLERNGQMIPLLEQYKVAYKKRMFIYQCVIPSLLSLVGAGITHAAESYASGTKFSTSWFLCENLIAFPLLSSYFSDINQNWHLKNKPLLPSEQKITYSLGDREIAYTYKFDSTLEV